ncbi:hypothetical protein VTK26DRAFT_4743 [Humicola hyalothermophila]
MGSVTDKPLAAGINGHGLSTFHLPDLSSGPTSSQTPTGMREDILLLSWLIVLLRSREDADFSFEWAYSNRKTGAKGDQANVMQLSAKEVMPGLDTRAAEVAVSISRHIAKAIKPHTAGSSSASLLLSTGSLSQIAGKGTQDGPLLHLETRFDGGLIEICPVWHSETMLPFTVTRHIETLVDTVKLLISNPDNSIHTLLGPTRYDLDEIWRWNHELPPTCDFCMHDVISERARKHPHKTAIDSWDGSLTYGQVDRYSTLLAQALRDKLGVELHDFVPLCFEKSRWTIVAVLAVMKAGATMVMMDPSLPLARLQNMAKQVGSCAMLTSRAQYQFSRSVLPDGQHIVVEEETFNPGQETPAVAPAPLSAVPPSALMYIIFTSGSTGTPKGVKISHRTYSSSAIPRARAVGYTEESRVLDFASYAFDVSIDSMLLTLANGGCLCIPSDEDRLNDINGAMRRMQVNYAGITPSVARVLDLDVIASLSGLGLGGEAASARDVNLWGTHTRIIIGYGPCECTIGCTVNSSAAKGRDYISIGPGNGAAIWIVDPNDHETLMPVGAVGELLVEGPIVGQGYLNDPEKTAAAFIEDPSWLTRGHGPYRGRRGRLYKTGDLGRYDPDGSGEIVFVGRKDTQVKLRGQRVELGEIESQLKARLPQEVNVIAEVIVPEGSARGQPTLVAFVSSQGHFAKTSESQGDLEYAKELHVKLWGALAKADKEVAKVLPRYMVPTAYIPVNRIPRLISGKTDRKSLREFGAKVDLRLLTVEKQEVPAAGDAGGGDRSGVDRPLTGIELRLRQAWGVALKLDPEAICPSDNFFALGGDSLAAMRLVSVCREHGLDLSVTSTFGKPTLSAMATVATPLDNDGSNRITKHERAPFSLVPQLSLEAAKAEAAQSCGIEVEKILDLYPCTPTQESLFTFSLKSLEAYIAQRVASIPSDVSVDAWKQAWDMVVAECPILRTRLVQLPGHSGLGQAVLDETIQWRHTSIELTQYLEEDRNARMDLGQSLARYAIVEPPGSGKRYMVWTLHHAVYDGWSEPLVLEMVRDALHRVQHDVDTSKWGVLRSTIADMGDLVKFVHCTDEAAMQDFWRRELQGAVGPQFPKVPSRDFLPNPDGLLERQIALDLSTKAGGFPFTLATLIRGAWALVASQFSGNDDVVFGETLTGRDIALPGVEGILGPLNATVPIRVRIDRGSTVASYLRAVQQTMSARIPYQHMGMQNIRKVSRDAQYACEAPSGLVIQPEPEHGASHELGFEHEDVVHEAIHFNPYSLMIACGIQKGGFRACASFDSSLVDAAQMERVLAQLETACLELAKDLDRTLDQVSCLPAAELNQIWTWNREPPCLLLDSASGTLRADPARIKPGSTYHPRATVPWVCDLRNPSMLSPIGCPGELWLEGTCWTGGVAVDCPAWLSAGSTEHPGRTGKVQPTGDIVKLQHDGSLVYLGRKSQEALVRGHPADLADLELHFGTYLPSSVRAAAVAVQTSLDIPGQELVRIVFMEQPSSSISDPCVKIMPNSHSIRITNETSAFETTLCAAAPASLVAAVKRLDKFAENSLAPHLIPSAYVVVSTMPVNSAQIDRGLLTLLASEIPKHVLDQLQEGFKEAWKTTASAQGTATVAEDILRTAWAKILGLAAEQIDVDDNFFRLGGDSVLAMKLVSHLRGQGHGLTVADIFRHMRLGDAAKVLKLNQYKVSVTQACAGPQPYQPFSMLGGSVPARFVREFVRPKLADAGWSVQDVYPVTDSQALDVRATIEPPRTSIQYTMLYFPAYARIDQERLFSACQKLVDAHDILRTVFIEHEATLYQVVLEKLDIAIAKHVAERNDLQTAVRDICTAHADTGHFRLGLPFVNMFFVEAGDGQQCLIIGLSHAQYDGISLPRLLEDLEALYAGKKTAISVPFSSYIAQTSENHAQEKAIQYWRNLLDGSSLSVLDEQIQAAQPNKAKAIFRSNPVDGVSQPPSGTTTATLLTASWATLLARRLKTPDVTFGNITSGRNMGWMPDAENIMGPCYQFTPVRIRMQQDWTAKELLNFAQRQSAESLAHDFIGFDMISKQCSNWSSPNGRPIFFDSIVHHQDWDDVDSMPFANGSCKVDILNPHGDAAYPLKAVSFVRDGTIHVGVVGRETDAAFVESLLGELTAVVKELASPQLVGGQRLLDDALFIPSATLEK